MLGAHHAASGAAAWIALTTQFEVSLGAVVSAEWAQQSVVLGAGLLDVGPTGVITGAMVTAGAALVPDADHRRATIAHSLPPVSNVVCTAVGRVAGGHRRGTHSILGAAGFVAIAWLAGLASVETERFGTVFPAAGLLCVLLVAFAAKALRFIPDRLKKTPWAVGIAVAAFITAFSPEQQNWFPLAMAIGVVAHLLGDMVTTGGINLLWPVRIRPPKALRRVPVLKRIWRPNGNFSLPLLGNAGSWREWLILVPVSAYVVLVLAGAAAELSQAGVSTFVATR
ncbi:membrane-bound metal-dependent hydrolase [Arthrobacter crystallopoietes BAB-32]|uniref:Membrane-bound metal-dependent hydrolase n=1 Tax=Arthrobacter crystallopoietes BAB-32 TaxID=1246476 RepID=N1UZJ7_9MICC|nr:metal-dependent hydrolase [Arthrobacter crystallopoietes]EMY34495.1 membrane-bound metal-dependent hydrolase [Arthrobacter crystallopoietes BAB-32]